jgi:hypothetical protein
VDRPLGNSDTVENCYSSLLYPRRQSASLNQRFYLGEVSAVSMRMFIVLMSMMVVLVMLVVVVVLVLVPVFVGMFMGVLGGMIMRVRMFVFPALRVVVHVLVSMLVVILMVVTMVVIMFMRQVDIELRAFDGLLLRTVHVKVIPLQAQFLQLHIKRAGVYAKIEHRANKHVAADAAKNIQVKSFHWFATSALIWLAA